MNNTLQELTEKLQKSEEKLSDLALQKAQQEKQIEEIKQLIKQEQSKIITDFEIGDVFEFSSSGHIIIIPYGWHSTFQKQLYWWVDKNLSPYSVIPDAKGMTKERMLKELNNLPQIRFLRNIREVVKTSFLLT